MVKPFQKNELLARLNALMRRSTTVRTTKLTASDYVLDLARKELTFKDEIVVLTSFEYLTLEFFMRNPRQLVSKWRLLVRLYGNDNGGLNIVETMVSRLRKKLTRDGSDFPITTVRY